METKISCTNIKCDGKQMDRIPRKTSKWTTTGVREPLADLHCLTTACRSKFVNEWLHVSLAPTVSQFYAVTRSCGGAVANNEQWETKVSLTFNYVISSDRVYS